MEELIAEVRAIVISCQGGISFNDLRRDFLDFTGSPKMYEDLGFKSIKDFVLSKPEEFPVENEMVFATLRKESAHIQKLVNEQGKGKEGRKSRIAPPAQIKRPKSGGSHSRSSKYGPRQCEIPSPSHRTLSDEQDDEDYSDYGDIFKDIPPLYDPVPPPDTAITKPPAPEKQPPATTSKSSAPSHPVHFSLTDAARVSSLPSPCATHLGSKAPAASRLVCFKALTQPTQAPPAQIKRPKSGGSHSRSSKYGPRQYEIPPRFRPSTHWETVQNDEQVAEKPARKVWPSPSHRTLSDEQGDEDYSDYGDIFKDIPPLYDPVPPPDTAIIKPPAPEKQPPATTSKSSAPSHPVHFSLTDTARVSSLPSPCATHLGSKAPAASRLVCLQALTQPTQAPPAQIKRRKSGDSHSRSSKYGPRQNDIPPRFRPLTHWETVQNDEQVAEKPARKVWPSPSHRTLSDEQGDEDYSDYGDIFKDIPPLYDPVPPPDTAIIKPPAPEKQPPATTSKSSAPSHPVHFSLTDAARVSSLPSPSATHLGSKTPAASRLARLKALTQPTQDELQMVASASSNSRVTRRDDLKDRLLQLCSTLNIPMPGFKVATDGRGKNKVYTCSITVADETFENEPVADEGTAMSLALSKAYIWVNKMSASMTPAAPQSTALFLDSIHKMLQERPAGVWLESLADAYQDTFHVAAPARWQEAVASCLDFTTATVMGRLLLQVKTTTPPPGFDSKFNPVVPSTSFTARATAQTTLFGEAAAVPLPLSPKKPSENYGKSLNPRQLPPLDTPSTQYWDLFVLFANPPCEIFARIIGPDWSEKYDEMMDSLELEMMSGGKAVVAPVAGEIYAVQDKEIWLRVRLERVLPDARAKISFIDEGGDKIVDIDQIFHLDDQFFNLAPQAFRLSLNGLMTFPDVPGMRKLMIKKLRQQSYIAEIVEVYPEVPKNRYLACAIIWDTTTPEDINVNSLLMEQVVATLQAPFLSTGTNAMVVSHVDDGIYLQAANQNVQCIACLLEFCVNCYPQVDIAVHKIFVQKISVVKNYKTDTWQRARVLALEGDMVVVRLIDYGPTIEVKCEEIYDAEKICPALAIAPAQAIKVTLSGIEHLTGKKLMAARIAMPPGEVVLAQVVDNYSRVPTVELYRRKPSDNTLQSINEMLNAI